jgi:hypothetical protein
LDDNNLSSNLSLDYNTGVGFDAQHSSSYAGAEALRAGFNVTLYSKMPVINGGFLLIGLSMIKALNPGCFFFFWFLLPLLLLPPNMRELLFSAMKRRSEPFEGRMTNKFKSPDLTSICRVFMWKMADYEKLKSIGRGGFATVYSARHKLTGGNRCRQRNVPQSG